MTTVRDIYSEIDRHAPFASAEPWDNCGMLVGDWDGAVIKAVTALDITGDVILEAERLGAQVIVSHHPVIFHPLKQAAAASTVGMLLKKGISAICVHTPFDMSPEGMPAGLLRLLEKPLGLIASSEELLEEHGSLGIGRVYEMEKPLSPEHIAAAAKEALGCPFVRFTVPCEWETISKIAVSSGAGGSLISAAVSKGAGGLISGDFRHDAFVDSYAYGGIALFDCGHFYTERIFCGLMKDILERAFPELEIIPAESCTDPVKYI